MNKILFLPLLRMQSGHHQVAEALMDMFRKHADGLILKKVDLLSYTNESLEKMISKSYLKWIRYAPGTYNLAYKNFFYLQSEKEHSFHLYEHIFLNRMVKLIDEEKPDVIICTHGFPSYLLSKLKKKGKCTVPIINVYTDFFINKFWGRDGIDLHLLPNQDIKEMLLNEHHISEQNMIVTGIPVHEEITSMECFPTNTQRPKILVAGGNSGLGSILKLENELKQSSQADYLILCGNNKKLFQEISSWNLAHVKPLPYISSRSDMNKLYEQVDVIVTKPGGVTVSEALYKKLPIFVHSVLPGQEKINLQYLKAKGLVIELNQGQALENQILSFLKDTQKIKQWNVALDLYQNGIELDNPKKMVEMISEMLVQKTDSVESGVYRNSQALQMARA